MKVRFLQSYKGYKQGDIVEILTMDARGYIANGIVERYIPKQAKSYLNKMMKKYQNK